jgi:hypothetical protein
MMMIVGGCLAINGDTFFFGYRIAMGRLDSCGRIVVAVPTRYGLAFEVLAE